MKMLLLAAAFVASAIFPLATPASATTIDINAGGSFDGKPVFFVVDFDGTKIGPTTWRLNDLLFGIMQIGPETVAGSFVGEGFGPIPLSSYAGADNRLFGPENALLPDSNGISFTADLFEEGPGIVGPPLVSDFNLFNDGSGNVFLKMSEASAIGYPENGVLLDSIRILAIRRVPESTTISLALAGLLVGFAMIRRRRPGLIS